MLSRLWWKEEALSSDLGSCRKYLSPPVVELKGQAWFQVALGRGGRETLEPVPCYPQPCAGWRGSIELTMRLGLEDNPEEWWALLPVE